MSQPWRGRFFTFWIAQAVSLIGSNLAQFGITWWLTKATGSATVLATVSLVSMLPGVVLGPLVGVLVDRWPRRLIIMAADTVGALGAAILLLLFWREAIEIWHVYAIALVRSLAGTFHFAAVQSSTSLMVPEDQLARVAGLNQSLQGINLVVAPPLGALLLEWLKLPGMMAIDVVTALVAVALVFLITIPQPVRNAAVAQLSIISDLRTGISYLWRWPGLRMAVLGGALLNMIFAPAFSLLPLLVTNHFNGVAWQFAALNTTLGLSFVAGGLLLSVWGGFQRKIYTALFGLAGSALGTLLIGIAPANGYWLAIAGMAIFGAMNSITNGPLMAIMQSVVAPEMQGRFFTVLMSLSQGVVPLGLLVAGPVSDAFGVQIWYLVGTICSIILCIVMVFTPAIMTLEDHRYEATPPSPSPTLP